MVDRKGILTNINEPRKAFYMTNEQPKDKPQQEIAMTVRCTEVLDAPTMCTEIARLMSLKAQIMYVSFVAVAPQHGIDISKTIMVDLWRAFYCISTDIQDDRAPGSMSAPRGPKIAE